MPQVGTGADYIAETQGDKRPSEDVIPGSFKHEIDDPATEQLAPFPVYTPPEVEAPTFPVDNTADTRQHHAAHADQPQADAGEQRGELRGPAPG